MDTEKLAYLSKGLFDTLKGLTENSAARWGVMNAQEMVEHLTMFFDVSYEKLKFPLSVPEEHLPKYKAFLWSDKQFRENTKAPVNILSDVPMPLAEPTLDAARNKLLQSVVNFSEYFKANPNRITMHPAFGMLNFEEWVLLHFKHVMHHFNQFGLHH